MYLGSKCPCTVSDLLLQLFNPSERATWESEDSFAELALIVLEVQALFMSSLGLMSLARQSGHYLSE